MTKVIIVFIFIDASHVVTPGRVEDDNPEQQSGIVQLIFIP